MEREPYNTTFRTNQSIPQRIIDMEKKEKIKLDISPEEFGLIKKGDKKDSASGISHLRFDKDGEEIKNLYKFFNVEMAISGKGRLDTASLVDSINDWVGKYTSKKWDCQDVNEACVGSNQGKEEK